MRIRATTKLRNDHLISAREQRGWSQKELALAARVSIDLVQDFECLRYNGRKDANLLEDHAEKIAICLGISVEDVAPVTLLGSEIPATHREVREVDTEHLLAAVERRDDHLYLPAPDEELQNEETMMVIDKALKTLSYREGEIIKLRYGIGGGFTYTCEEIGRMLKITRERVRQVEAKAIQKLQKPHCAGRIKAAAF